MKYLAPILFLLLFTTSCEKKYCWQCTIFTEVDYLYNSALDSFDSDKEEICDYTESQMREYEEQNTFVTEHRDGIYAYHYDYKSSCICIK